MPSSVGRMVLRVVGWAQFAVGMLVRKVECLQRACGANGNKPSERCRFYNLVLSYGD